MFFYKYFSLKLRLLTRYQLNMRTFFTIILSLFVLFSLGQVENKILIQVLVVDQNDNPVSDVYIVNMNTQEKDVSRPNGVFTIWVTPDDSLAVSHISYERQIITANSVLVNPKIVLKSDNINIKEINVSANQKSEMERAMENIEQMKFDMRTQPDDALTESERVHQAVTANNRIERSSAGMLSLFKFSPSSSIKKVADKLKKEESSNFSSTKKTKKEIEDAKKGATDTIPKLKKAPKDTIQVNDSTKKEIPPIEE